jgi:hypothetical protein
MFPNQFSGLTSWFSGASFRATAGGTIAKLSNNKTLTCTVWSNRGQYTEVKLNEFRLKLDAVSSSAGLGWNWKILFTCRPINSEFEPVEVVIPVVTPVEPCIPVEPDESVEQTSQ